MMEEDDFLKSICFDDLKEKYLTEKKQMIRDIQESYKQDEEFHKKSKQQGIEIDKKHRDILNSCIYPFTQKGSLAQTNYRYVRIAPLYEFDIPNYDFLLFNRENNIVILGEAKGSIANPTSIVHEAEKRKIQALEHITDIKTKYLHLDKDDAIRLECVIAVPSNDVINMVNAVAENGGNFIVWHAPLTGDSMLSFAAPSKNTQFHDTMMHADHVLARNLDKTKSTRRAFNFFPQAHIVSKLYLLVLVATPGESGLEVKKEDISAYLSEKDMFFSSKTEIDAITEGIIQKGRDIDFLDNTTVDGVYRIKSRGTRRITLETSMNDKWIKYKLNKDMKKLENDGISKLQTKYTELMQQRPKLEQFIQ